MKLQRLLDDTTPQKSRSGLHSHPRTDYGSIAGKQKEETKELEEHFPSTFLRFLFTYQEYLPTYLPHLLTVGKHSLFN